MQWNTRTAAVAALIGIGVTVVQPGQAQSDRFSTFWGTRYSASRPAPSNRTLSSAASSTGEPADPMHHWNAVAMDSVALDHTPVTNGDVHSFGEQLGPGRAARALAIVHVAIFDAVNSIEHRYQSFTGIPDVPGDASMDAAIAQAAHDTLVNLYPSQRAHCDAALAAELARLPNGFARTQGVATGRRAARDVLARAGQDGSTADDPMIGVDYIPGDQPGEWRPDPVSGSTVALGAMWGQVRPLVMESAVAHRVPPPPSLTSREYAEAYNEVKRLGGDDRTTPTVRTNDQTMAGIFWAYDGTPHLGPPPRLFNQIVMAIADKMGTTDTVDLARLLALANVAMSDSGIASWESKYYWKVWRPVTAIREADAGTGPSGLGDGNPATQGDPGFTPLGAQASNLMGPNFTPPFPAYPSGHATFGGAVYQVLRDVYGTDNIAMTLTSDELDGVTLDNTGIPRALLPRTFASLSQAEEENGQSRVYLGIHWSFDKTAGIAQGRAVADEIVAKAARPR